MLLAQIICICCVFFVLWYVYLHFHVDHENVFFCKSYYLCMEITILFFHVKISLHNPKAYYFGKIWKFSVISLIRYFVEIKT